MMPFPVSTRATFALADKLPAVMNSATITILADDLTGACDAAAAFLADRQEARVWLTSRAQHETGEKVQAFHTDSRALTAEQAAAAVAEAASEWAPSRQRFVFKKVDSAGRGPIAAELLALERILSPDAAILALAFPAAGRVVESGTLRITDATGSASSLSLAELFPTEEQHRIAVIHNPAEIDAALNAKKSLLICDAASDADLDSLASVTASKGNFLYAGSAGLARALARHFGAIAQEQPYPYAARLMIFCGTPHPLTQLQFSHLEAEPDSVRVERLRCAEDERETIVAAFRKFAPEALLLTGGETAQLVLRSLGAESILLRGECAPGIPWGTIQGGLADGVIVITKSGGFGAATVLSEIAEKLRGVR